MGYSLAIQLIMRRGGEAMMKGPFCLAKEYLSAHHAKTYLDQGFLMDCCFLCYLSGKSNSKTKACKVGSIK